MRYNFQKIYLLVIAILKLTPDQFQQLKSLSEYLVIQRPKLIFCPNILSVMDFSAAVMKITEKDVSLSSCSKKHFTRETVVYYHVSK